MKCIRGLSSVALMSLLTVNSGVAMSKGIEQAPIPPSSSQTKPVIMANFLRDLGTAIQTVDKINQIRLQEQRRQEAERRQQELEAARKAATEQQRLEAERRQQYFESLSPEEKEAYLAEQRARREQADKAAALLLMMLFSGGSGSSDRESTQQNTTNECGENYKGSLICPYQN